MRLTTAQTGGTNVETAAGEERNDPSGDPDETTGGSGAMWLVRANVRGRSRLDAWLAEGYCAIGWWEIGEVLPGTSREALVARLEVAYPDRPPGSIRNSAGNIDRFVKRIRRGDLVVTPDGPELFVGRVASAPSHHPRGEEAHRRSVEWLNPSWPLRRHGLSATAQAKLRTMLTVTDLSAVRDEVEAELAAARPDR